MHFNGFWRTAAPQFVFRQVAKRCDAYTSPSLHLVQIRRAVRYLRRHTLCPRLASWRIYRGILSQSIFVCRHNFSNCIVYYPAFWRLWKETICQKSFVRPLLHSVPDRFLCCNDAVFVMAKLAGCIEHLSAIELNTARYGSKSYQCPYPNNFRLHGRHPRRKGYSEGPVHGLVPRFLG